MQGAHIEGLREQVGRKPGIGRGAQQRPQRGQRRRRKGLLPRGLEQRCVQRQRHAAEAF